MVTKKIFINDNYIGLGNIIYFLAFCFRKFNTTDITVYTTNKFLYYQRRLFKFEILLQETDDFDIQFSDVKFDDFLGTEFCDFEAMKKQINFEYLDGFKYQFSTDNICVVNLRFGNYMTGKNAEIYKTMNLHWLNDMMTKYDVKNKYDIVFVSDSGQMAKKMANILGIDVPIVANDALLCFNLLLKAKFIIGSCSTFSFAGCMLNNNGAKMVVEYPYYKTNNPYDWGEKKNVELYDSERIIKEPYVKKEYKAVVCTIIKDERRYLEEWIRHNIKIGFSKIYLFEDIGSESHADICSKYKEVELKRIEDTNYLKHSEGEYGPWRQAAMMNMFLEECRLCGDWVAMIDVDEFIVFDKGYNLQRLFSEFKDENGIYIYWKNYGANGFVNEQEGNAFEVYNKEGKVPFMDLRWSFKSLINLNILDVKMNPPHIVIDGVNTLGMHTTGIRCCKKCHINHYVTKSFEDWVKQLFYRGDVAAGHRKFDLFFEVNEDMKPNREELIRSLLNTDGETPKVIHYCWFGGSEMNDIQKKCIESWKKFAPEYEIKRWDETNYDIHKNKVVEYLYENGKYAFLSDYVRSDIMYQFGGVYFDTDVEMIKPLEDIAKNGPFFAYGGKHKIIRNGLGYMVPKGNFIDKTCMEWIERQDLSHDFSVNKYITSVFELFKINYSDDVQDFNGIKLYPTEYFDPMNFETGEIVTTINTVTIHHGTHLW